MANWTNAELRACVKAYMQMLDKEARGKSFVKTEVNRRLRRGPLSTRTKASVELRMQNISAVLYSLGLKWIDGYKPKKNVGTKVRERLIRMIEEVRGIDTGEYEPTSDPEDLAERTRGLRGRRTRPKASGNRKPKRVPSFGNSFERLPAVRADVLDAANGNCELCRNPGPFKDTHGEPFLEVHHVALLSQGGPDTTDNAVALCPNCHRRTHYSADSSVAVEALYEHVERLRRPNEPEAGDPGQSR